MNWFNLAMKLKGFPMEKAKEEYAAVQEEKTKLVDKRKNAILTYHLAHNPLYKKLLNGRKINHWEELPILTKEHLQQPLEKRISDGFKRQELLVSKTSGSSGFPFIYAKDKFCHAMTWVHYITSYNALGIDYGKAYQARFYAIPKHKLAYYAERMRDVLSNRKRFVVFDLSDDKLDAFMETFKKEAFDYVYGYTSAIVLFAKHLKKNKLTLKEICPTVQCCITTSELLDDIDRELLEQQFGIPVYNEYGASELDLIAIENQKREWLVNNNTLYVEIVDENDNVLPNGEIGRIVVTSLYNKAHPFIRYEVGDMGALSKKSTPEKPILEKLIGRTYDFAILPSEKKVPAFTFYYIAKTIAQASGNIKELKIIQKEKAHFLVHYTSKHELSTIHKQKLKEAFATYLEPDLKVSFIRLEHLERTKNGKLKQFESWVNQT